MYLSISPTKPVEPKPFRFGNTYFAVDSKQNSLTAEVTGSNKKLVDTYFINLEGLPRTITSNREGRKATNSCLRGQGRFEYRITGNAVNLFAIIYKKYGRFEFFWWDDDLSPMALKNAPQKIGINDIIVGYPVITDQKFLVS